MAAKVTRRERAAASIPAETVPMVRITELPEVIAGSISKTTVRRHIKAGLIPSHKIGGSMLVPRDAYSRPRQPEVA